MIQNDSELFKVNVENYNGPLEVLLDLAKAQKVNLEDISTNNLIIESGANFNGACTMGKEEEVEDAPEVDDEE